MVLIEEVLWNIFTYYSLHGNPKDPSRLHSLALLKLCKDVHAMDASMVENALSQQDFQLIYTAILKDPTKNKHSKSDKIDFEEFLRCLIKISQKCYPSYKTKEASMQQLLMDNILPLALRREPVSISSIMKTSSMEALLRHFESAFSTMFRFFAVSSDEVTKNKGLIKSLGQSNRITASFEEHRSLIEEATSRCRMESALSKHMAYTDFIRFAHEVGLVSSLTIPIIEYGNIFLAVTSFSNFTTTLRRIDGKEFVEAMVRIGLLAFAEETISDEDRIKALLLNMWRYLQEQLRQHMLTYGRITGGHFHDYKEAFFKEHELFLNKFKVMWGRDNYRNYLLVQPKGAPNEEKSTASKVPNSPHSPGSVTAVKTSIGSPSLIRRLKATSDARDADESISGQQTSQSASDELMAKKDLMANTLLDRIEESESFSVRTSDDSEYRIAIPSDEKFDGGRILPEDLRRLFLFRPDVAHLVYELLVEERLVDGTSAGIMGEGPDGLSYNTIGEVKHIDTTPAARPPPKAVPPPPPPSSLS